MTVDLGYARYQGVPFLDPITNITNTQFLGIRYAAAPTGRILLSIFFFVILQHLLLYWKQDLGDSEGLNLLLTFQVFS